MNNFKVWPSLIVLHQITPSLPLHRLTAQPSGPCELYTTWFLYCTTPFVHSKKQRGKAQKTHPTPHTMCQRHRPPHLTKTDTLLESTDSPGHIARNWHSSLLHHRTVGTRHPLPPHGILVLHQIIYDYLILYTYIHCQDARDLDIIVFCLFVCLFVCFCFLFFGLLLHIVHNFSLKLCTTWWWPPLWPKHVGAF